MQPAYLAFKVAMGAAGIAFDRLIGRKRPFIVNHLVTVRCNLQCPFCYVSGPEQREFNKVRYPHRSEMDTEEMIAFYRQLVAEDFKMAIILGGEPLLRTDFGKILQVLHGHLYTTIFTNGYLLAERAEMLATASNVFVSLDAPDAQHDEIRATPGSFRRAVAGIEELRQRSPRVHVAANMTVTKANAHRVREMLQFAQAMGIGVSFQPPSFEGQFTVDDRPRATSASHAADQAVVASAFRQIREAAAAGQRVIGSKAFFDLVVEDKRSFPCFYPTYALGPVLPNGDVVACTNSKVIGSVRRSSVREILESPAFEENAARGPVCATGCRDFGIHDLSAVYSRQFTLQDARRYLRAFVTAMPPPLAGVGWRPPTPPDESGDCRL